MRALVAEASLGRSICPQYRKVRGEALKHWKYQKVAGVGGKQKATESP